MGNETGRSGEHGRRVRPTLTTGGHRRRLAARWIRVCSSLTLAAFVVAIGLEMFLVPNRIIDGGVVGLAIMGSYLTGLPFGIYMVGLNLPFLYLGYKQIGLTFAIATLYAVGALSLFSIMLQGEGPITKDPLLAAVFGGLVIGLGVGAIIRSGGSLDGTEIVAIVLSRQLPFSVGEVVMGFNIIILGSAGFVFGWNQAMYSLIAFFIAYKAIDLAVQGLDESKSALIITEQPEAIRDAIVHRLGRGVTELAGKGGYSGDEKSVFYCVVTRLEVAKLKSIILEHDPGAFVAIEDVHEVLGGRRSKRAIH